ncbi:MAG: hypothetical protein ABEI80_05515 [Haloplanus sp.]
MANDPDPETQVSVSTGEVRVGKTFEADRFPVPAIAFEIESLADEPIRIRLVDQIPDSFAMEGVGFHPDYDSDNWTAYRDHRVAYERTLEPGESVLTVYGIRIDDPEEAEQFLDEPTVEVLESEGSAAQTGDVLGRETTQVVRDALSGEDSGDLSALSESESLLGDDAPTPRDTDDDLTASMGDRDEDVTAVDVSEEEAAASESGEADAAADAADTEAEAEEDDDESEDESVPSADVAEALDPRPERPVAGDASEESAEPAAEKAGDVPPGTTGSVAAGLAAEIRAGTVDDDDLATIEDALDGGVPTSVDVRVGRLQSQVEDLLAYRDALADFLDENGTAEEVLTEVSEEVDDLTDRVAALEASLEEAESDREDLHDEVTALSDSVAEVSDQVESVGDELAGIETTVENFDDRLTRVETLRSDIEDIQDELDELQTFRDRLSSAFGPGEE